MSGGTRRSGWYWLVLLAAVCIPLALPLLGRPPFSLSRLFDPDFVASTGGQIFWQIRVPRVLLGYLVGAALAVSGMVFQAMFRNPLATPFTLGVSSGAALGAALAVKLGIVFAWLGFSGITICSFLGALLTVATIYLLASVKREFSTEFMLLSGVALSFFFSSAILFIQYLSDFAGSFQLVRWLMGDLNTVGYTRPVQLLVILVPCLLLVYLFTPDLNLLLAGEDLARTRGVDVVRARVVLFLVVSVLTGAVVSICGPIGFVGMMVPHFLRLLLGAEHRRLLWACGLGGGAFLAACDFVARSLISPAEIPVGVLTALLGGPFFLWLLLRRRGGQGYF